MNLLRGDVCLARFPHAAGGRGKKRPVVIVQADVYNSQLRHAIVAEITSNLSGTSDPANLLVELSAPDGLGTGLKHDSLVTCLHLISMAEDRIGTKIGTLSPGLPHKLDACLKATLGLT
jgi:mRNA-degrading endonuclease toxin of MazEF toxin-antitoxin module